MQTGECHFSAKFLFLNFMVSVWKHRRHLKRVFLVTLGWHLYFLRMMLSSWLHRAITCDVHKSRLLHFCCDTLFSNPYLWSWALADNKENEIDPLLSPASLHRLASHSVALASSDPVPKTIRLCSIDSNAFVSDTLHCQAFLCVFFMLWQTEE